MTVAVQRKRTPEDWRALRARRSGRPRRLVLVNRKGGSGKTTTAVQLAAAYACWGLRVRLVDGDAQLASSTYWLPPAVTGEYPTLLEVFTGKATLAEVTAPTSVPGISIVPSLGSLGQVETNRPAGSDTLLAAEYADAEDDGDLYDVEILDCAPAIGAVTVAMLTAGTDIGITIKASQLDYVGAAELAEPLALIRKRLNRGLRTSAAIMVDTDQQTLISDSLAKRLALEYPGAVVRAIPHSVRAAEAPGQHVPLIDYAPDNPVTLAYWALAYDLAPALNLAVDAA